MAKPTKSNQSPCICIRMRRAAQKMTEFYGQKMATIGLTINQYSLLANISQMEGCGTGELARKVGQEKSTLVRTLQPLLRDGLIQDNSLENGRRHQFHLTPHGKSVLDKAMPLWLEAQSELALKAGKSLSEILDFFDALDCL